MEVTGYREVSGLTAQDQNGTVSVTRSYLSGSNGLGEPFGLLYVVVPINSTSGGLGQVSWSQVGNIWWSEEIHVVIPNDLNIIWEYGFASGSCRNHIAVPSNFVFNSKDIRFRLLNPTDGGTPYQVSFVASVKYFES